MNIFDSYQTNVHSVVGALMGRSATWTPSAGGEAITDTALFGYPSRKEMIDEADFNPSRPRMQYLDGQFPGLLESIEGGNNEPVSIDGVNYVAFARERLYDGKTITIFLEVSQ